MFHNNSPGELPGDRSIQNVYVVQEDAYLNQAFHNWNKYHESILRTFWISSSSFLWQEIE